MASQARTLICLRYRNRPFLWLWPRAKAESTKFMRCLEPAMSFCVMGVLSAIFGVWARMRMERLWVRCSPLRYFMRGRASLAFSVSVFTQVMLSTMMIFAPLSRTAVSMSVLRLVSMSSGMSILSRSTWRR